MIWADTSDANPGDGVAEDALGNTTLRAAIEEANALAGVDNIDSSVVGNILLTMGTPLEITSEININGGGQITVDGGGVTGVFSVFDGLPGALTVSLDNLTITGGYSYYGGGAVRNGENLTIANSDISGNSANTMFGHGGAIYNTGELTIDNTSVTSNQAADGGGIYNQYGIVDLNSATISGNTATSNGGGILSLGSLEIDLSSISDNTADNYGGAIADFGTADIRRTNFVYNEASSGGAVFINSCFITGHNQLDNAFAYNEATFSSGSPFTGSGGAISASGGALNLDQITVSSNTAANGGGGIAIRDANAMCGTELLIRFSTIAFNSATAAAGQGGGILVEDLLSTLDLVSTIVGDNSVPNVANGPDINANSIDAEFSLISNTTGIGVIIGANNQNGVSPDLAPLSLNGGPTLNHALNLNSPAVDNGKTAETTPHRFRSTRRILRTNYWPGNGYRRPLNRAQIATLTTTATMTWPI